MPVQINEMVVRTNVSERTPPESPSSAGSSGNLSARTIQEIVDQVLDILKEKTER